jgi:hypothetical protein
MRISTLLIADAARVRDGLLSVIGGGVTNISAAGFPMNPQADLAVIVDVAPGEWPGQFPVRITLERGDSAGFGETLIGYEGLYAGEIKRPDEPALVPLAMTLGPLEVPAPGRYEVVVAIGDLPVERLPLVVAEIELPPGFAQ